MSAAPTLEVKEQGRAGAHNMDKQELLDAFEAGDFGDVEFFDLALDAGLSMDEIGEAMRRKAQFDYMEDLQPDAKSGVLLEDADKPPHQT
jgi:hypothetical protein